jgi:hypothetical protein
MSDQSKAGPYEDRPGWASCFKPHNPNSKADFTGVTVLGSAKKKCWVNVYLKQTRNGDPYVSVHIKPWQDQPSEKDKPQEARSKETSRGLAQ